MPYSLSLHKINKWLIYSTIAILPLYIFRFSLFGVRTNILELIILLNFVFTLYQKYKEKELSSFKTLFTYPILVFVIAGFIGSGIAGFSGESLGILKGWIITPILFFYNFYFNIKKNEAKSSLLYLIIPVFIVSLLAILQKASLISTVFYQRGDYTFSDYLVQGRSFSLFESPNFLAMFLVPAIFLLIGARETIKKEKQFYFWLFLLLPLLSLYFSVSRAGIIALIFGAFIYILGAFLKKRGNSLFDYAPAFLIAFFFVLNISYLYFSTEAYTTTRGGDNVRIEIYRYSLQLSKDNWLFGVGLGRFQEQIALLNSNNIDFLTTGLPFALHPHNLFLAIWLNLGLLGILSFLSVLYLTFKKLTVDFNTFSLSSLAALFAILIHGLFDTTYFKNDLSVIFWLISAIVLTINSDAKQSSKN